MFIAALFRIIKTWKQPKCPSTDEWIKKMWHIHTIEQYPALKKVENPVIWTNMDEPRGHYAKYNKPDIEEHILYGPTYIKNLN